MHTIKITPNLLFEYISVQAANLSDCRIESKLFLPELECSTWHRLAYRTRVDRTCLRRWDAVTVETGGWCAHRHSNCAYI